MSDIVLIVIDIIIALDVVLGVLLFVLHTIILAGSTPLFDTKGIAFILQFNLETSPLALSGCRNPGVVVLLARV